MNINIKKEDVSINQDGTFTIRSPELKAKIEKIISTDPGGEVMWFDDCPVIHNHVAGCGGVA